MRRESTYTSNRVIGHYLHGIIIGQSKVAVHAGNCSFSCNTPLQGTREANHGIRRHFLTWYKGTES